MPDANDTVLDADFVWSQCNITPEDLAGKFIALDILVEDDQGLRYNIEMQVRRHKAYSARSTYYLARTFVGQLGSGQDYHQLKGVIGIHLLDYELFDAPKHQNQAVWCFEMRDRLQPDVKLGDELQLNITLMRKADRLKLASPQLADFLTFFEHWQEESIMNQVTSVPIQKAMAQLRALSADAATRETAWNRERALISEITERRAEREEGRQEGKKASWKTKSRCWENCYPNAFLPCRMARWSESTKPHRSNWNIGFWR